MDFVVLPEVRQAVQAYADQLVYGYAYASDVLIESVQGWEATQHSYHFNKEALIFIEGVVPAISTAIQAFIKEGEAVLINTPVYPPFARSVKLNNRRLITNSLVEKDGLLEIDFDQLEKDLVDENVKLYILCNPHNPGGCVWEREVLKRLVISAKNMVFCWFQMRFTKIWLSLITNTSLSTPLIPPLKTSPLS